MPIKYFYIFLLNSSFINIENIWNVFVSETDAFAYTSILVTCSPVPLVYVCVWTNAILSQSVCACVFSRIWLCDPKDCSPPGSSVLGISQARILEWVVIPYYKESSWSRNQTHVSCISCIGRWIFYCCTTWEVSESQKIVIAQKLFDNISAIQEAWRL